MKRLSATDIGLIGLAIITVGAGALATKGVSFAGSVPASPSPAATVSETTTASNSARPSMTASSSTSATASPSAAAPVEPIPSTEAADLVVLGDSTSNDIEEWVNELGAQIGETRRVRVQRVNQESFSSYNAPVTYGSADPGLQVWNASVTDPQPLDATSVDNLVPKATDLVLISQGRGSDAGTITTDLDESLAALRSARADVPVAVVLQPDDGSSAAAITAVEQWASRNSLPTIDVAAAFSGSSDALQSSDGTLTARGQILWAETVAAAVTGN